MKKNAIKLVTLLIVLLLGAIVSIRLTKAQSASESLTGNMNGDINQDGKISIADLNILISNFGRSVIPRGLQRDHYQVNLFPHQTLNLYSGKTGRIVVVLTLNGEVVTSHTDYNLQWIEANGNIIRLEEFSCSDCKPEGSIHFNVSAGQIGTEILTLLVREKRSANKLIAQASIPIQVHDNQAQGSCFFETSMRDEQSQDFLYRLSVNGSSSVPIIGYQFDFEDDGIWDTPLIGSTTNHSYPFQGIYVPRARMLQSNNTIITCNTTENINIPTDNPQASPTKMIETKHPVRWETETVSFVADDFWITVNGIEYRPPENAVSVRSDPGDSTYTTLEIEWLLPDDTPMRFSLYFKSDGQQWWSYEGRTYDGEKYDVYDYSWPEWLYYIGTMFKTTLGETYMGNVSMHSDPNYSDPYNWHDHQGVVSIENLRLQVFK